MTVDQSSNKSDSFWAENWIGLSLIGMMVLFVGVMFYMMTGPNQTARETALEAVILTSASIIASFLITKIYAEKSYNKSLRDHGVQIASGIMVLKRQMEGLTIWIGEKRASLAELGRTTEPSEAILEHVEQTLLGFKGMTDTALGGIAGVIGDALAQYEAVMDQVSTVRLQAFQQTSKIQQEMQTAVSNEEIVKLQTKIQEIGLQTEKQIAKLARTSALPIPALPPKRSYTAKCPYCKESSVIEMVDRKGETQVVACEYCGNAFNAHVTAAQTIMTRPSIGRYSETQELLMRNDLWVAPEQVDLLISLALTYDEKLKEEGKIRSPFNLQALIIEDPAGLRDSEISNSTVRRFLGLVFHGRAFTFEPNQRIIYKSVYVNNLTEDSLLKAYIRACVSRLASWKDIGLKDLPELQIILLGDKEGGDRVLMEAFKYAEREAQRVNFTKT
jgi:transcription elongation factor Elf1